MPLLFTSSQATKLSDYRTSFSGADIKAMMILPDYDLRELGNAAGSYPNSEGRVQEFGSIQTLSLSIFRDKREVRNLGFQFAAGYARGNTTIAGSMVFALLDKHPFNDDGSRIDKPHGSNGILSSVSGSVQVQDLSNQALATAVAEGDDEGLSTEGNPIGVVHRRHQFDFTWDQDRFGELMLPHDLPPFDIYVSFVNEAGGLGRIVLHGVDIHQEGMVVSIEDLFTEDTYQYTARGLSVFENGVYRGRLWTGSVRPWQHDYALNALRRHGN